MSKKLPILEYFIIVLFILGFTACKEEANEFQDLEEDVSYTDSFSPPAWENPLARQTIISGDKDIGQFIPEDVMDSEQRSILNLFQSLFRYLHNQQVNQAEILFTEAAYNSFKLRVTQLKLDRNYQLRISMPVQPLETQFTIKCKIIQNNTSRVGIFDLEKRDKSLKISDFDTQFFEALQ